MAGGAQQAAWGWAGEQEVGSCVCGFEGWGVKEGTRRAASLRHLQVTWMHSAHLVIHCTGQSGQGGPRITAAARPSLTTATAFAAATAAAATAAALAIAALAGAIAHISFTATASAAVSQACLGVHAACCLGPQPQLHTQEGPHICTQECLRKGPSPPLSKAGFVAVRPAISKAQRMAQPACHRSCKQLHFYAPCGQLTR
jgi:hypothetical protein